MNRKRLLTENTFVSGKYATQSQFTESYMIQEGLNIDEGERLKKAVSDVKSYKKESEVRNMLDL